jgi:hypothetical protein
MSLPCAAEQRVEAVSPRKSVDLTTSTFSVRFIALVASTSIWAATRRIAGLDIMTVLRTE